MDYYKTLYTALDGRHYNIHLWVDPTCPPQLPTAWTPAHPNPTFTLPSQHLERRDFAAAVHALCFLYTWQDLIYHPKAERIRYRTIEGDLIHECSHRLAHVKSNTDTRTLVRRARAIEAQCHGFYKSNPIQRGHKWRIPTLR